MTKTGVLCKNGCNDYLCLQIRETIVEMEKEQEIMNRCFVCNEKLTGETKSYNRLTNLPVCEECKGTRAEKEAEQDAFNSLAEGFVCGCI